MPAPLPFFKKYGFASAASFLRARNVPESLFGEMMADERWAVRKHVLLHVECPLRIRENIRLRGKIWYERLVAIWANSAPEGYWKYAKDDLDKRVRRLHSEHVFHLSESLRMLLLKLEVVDERQAKL